MAIVPNLPQNANSTNEDNLLKQWYTTERIVDLVYDEYPFTMLTRKNLDVSGRQIVSPQIISDPQGTSNTFSHAVGNTYPLEAATFLIDLRQKYSNGAITGKLLRQSRNDRGSFIDQLKMGVDKTLKTHYNRLHIDFTSNDGTSALAQIASATAIVLAPYPFPVAFQLSVPTQTRYFELNARVTVATNQDGTGNPAVGTVVKIDRSSGLITVSMDVAFVGPVNWMGFDGDFVNSDPASGAVNFQGLPAWLPTVAVRSVPGFLDVPFNGVVRSRDSDRNAGVAIDMPSSSVKSALIRLASAIRVNGGRPNLAYMHPFNFAQLADGLQTVFYDNVALATSANISYKAIVLQTPSGEIRIIQDSCMVPNRIYMLSQETWEIGAWSDFANIIQDDGLTILRGNDDSISWRARSFCSLHCNAVGFNGVVTI